MMEQVEMFDVAPQADERPSQHAKRIQSILRLYSERGLALETLADHKHLGLTLKTLQKYSRRAGVKFSDYVPRSMRPKKEKKARENEKPAV